MKKLICKIFGHNFRVPKDVQLIIAGADGISCGRCVKIEDL